MVTFISPYMGEEIKSNAKKRCTISKNFSNSANIKRKARCSKKYQSTCFKLKRELRKQLDDEMQRNMQNT